MAKKIKEEGTTRLHQAIGEALGQLVFHIVDKLPSVEEQMDLFECQFLALPFNILDKSQNKVQQSGAISCLTKILINCPDEVLFERLDEITDRIASVFKQKSFQA